MLKIVNSSARFVNSSDCLCLCPQIDVQEVERAVQVLEASQSISDPVAYFCLLC